ncbi:MAG TPA: hypothetical protein VHX66_08840 [Solirubrobacteraceae bacterium]|jgi:hypothetical protein|nr:hypothetical protein [Solirubrobacteraceae bacterium]
MAQTAFAHVEAAPALRCEYCGEELATYEPLWQELHDGTVTLSSASELDEHGTGRMWHPACLGRASVHLVA